MNTNIQHEMVMKGTTDLAVAPTIVMRLNNYDDDFGDGVCIVTLTENLLRRLHHYAELVRQFCAEHGANHVEFDFAEGVDHLERQPDSLENYDLWREEWIRTNEPYNIRHDPAQREEAAELIEAMCCPTLRVFRNGDMVFCSTNRWLARECETEVITSATLDAWETLLVEWQDR